jgi:hypothetical protein
MKHLVALNDEIIWGSSNGKCNMCTHTCITLKEMKTSMFSCYTLKLCLVVWMQYKLVCKNLANTFLLYHICIHFQGHLPIYGFVMIQLLKCFH